MSFISILIVDDDLNKISSIISTIKSSTSTFLSFRQASNVQEAIEELELKEFHLLITDLLMPLRFEGNPDTNGGASLLRSLYKKRGLSVPMYVVVLSQYPELRKDLNTVWQVWQYDATSDLWRKHLRDLIQHISLVNSRIVVKKNETVFVEGPTDKSILERAILLYYPKYIDKVNFETISFGGGAAWVERQLFIWAKTLAIKDKKTNVYLKSVGVFDDDQAANNAINRLHLLIESGTAESQTFSISKCSYKHSILLKSLKKKGLSFPTTLEDLIGIEAHLDAARKNWLSVRDPKLISVEAKLNRNTPLTEAGLRMLGVNESEIHMVLYKVNDDYKKSFINMILNQSEQFQIRVLESIRFLLEDILKKLKLYHSEERVD